MNFYAKANFETEASVTFSDVDVDRFGMENGGATAATGRALQLHKQIRPPKSPFSQANR